MKSLHKLLLVLASVLALSIEPATSEAQAPEFDAFFAFGDSLSDTGNLWLLTNAAGQDPAIPPSVSPHRTYFNGRFSNGPIAFEYLWDRIASNAGDDVKPFLSTFRIPQKGAVSFAFGASGTGFVQSLPGPLFIPGLNGQVEMFGAALRGRKAPRRALYAIFSGANDYLGGPEVALEPAVVVGNILNAIQKLYALGARDVMVLNLPDLSLIPLVPPDLKIPLSQLTQGHNYLLAQALNGLASSLPDLRLIQVDVFTFTNGLAGQPDAILTPALPPQYAFCLFINPASCGDVAFNVDARFFFWDAEHPTTATHAALGTFLYGRLLQ
jgi:phospholipase/lecithinase/hemolysin